LGTIGPSSDGDPEDRLRTLEEQVTRLTDRVDQLEQRLSGVSFPSLPPAWPLGETSLRETSGRTEITGWATLLGRSCLVLGGAFLIRALTDGRILPGALGVALGIGFAATWIFFSHRAAARRAPLSASVHAVIAALIAYPLILESTTRLGLMSTSLAAVTLAGFTGLLLMAAWRDRVSWLAWVGVLSCLLTTVVLLRTTPGRAELIGVLVVLTAACFFWLGERWPALRWAPAVVLDLVVLRAVTTSTPPVLLSSLALAGLSLALPLSRTSLGRPVGPFEAIQTVLGLVIGIAGALRASRDAGTGGDAVAVGILATSLLTIGFAGWIVPRRGNRDTDFLFYAALSLALLASGVALLAGGELRGVLWSVFAVVAVVLGRRSHPVSLWSLAALLAVGGAVGSGLLAGAVNPGSIAVLGLILAAYLVTIPPLQPSRSPPSTWRLSRLAPAVLLFLGSAGAAVLLLDLTGGLTGDLARLAAARTAAAVAIALILGVVRRRLERPELTWIAWLALALGGVELFLVGLPNGRASTLLVAFVLFGTGMILVPRLAPFGRDFFSPGRPR
jgi:hypothetical protein